MLDADHTQLAPEAEAAQPLYARYWLHNRGPAPLGGLPAVAHLHPQTTVAEPNDRSAAAAYRRQRLHRLGAARHGAAGVPRGWTAEPGELPFMLPTGEHLEADIELTLPPDAPPGLYPIRAQLAVTGDNAAAMPASWRQVVEDVASSSVGTPSEDNDLVRLVDGPKDVEVAAGERGAADGDRRHRRRRDLAVEAHLISPWGTWEWMGPAAQGSVLPGGETVDIGFDVAPPPWVEPGEWWALVRVGCAGRLRLFARGEGDGPMSRRRRHRRRDRRARRRRRRPRGASCATRCPPRRCRARAPARDASCAAG